MKKFGLKLAIFLLLLGVPFGVLNHLYKNTNYWKSANELYEVKNYPDNISLLNLGNSHEMFGFRYEKYYKGVANNFATSSQPFFYSYQVLKNAEASIEDDAVVIIPISYFDWYYDWRNLFAEIETYNNRYYSFLKPWRMYNFEFEKYIECGLLPLFTAKENVKFIIEDIGQPEKEPLLEYSVIDSGDSWVKSVVDYKYDSWMNDVMDMGTDKDKIYKENKADLIDMIDYCYDKGYTPVLLCSPMPDVLTERFSEDFMKDFDEKNAQICNMYPDLLFLDYSRDKSFSENLEFFKDADHMNSTGGDEFTKQVLNDLVKVGILDKSMVTGWE